MSFTAVSRQCCTLYIDETRLPDFDLQLFAEEKTEDPTAKRLSDAHKKGQVAKSQDLSAAIVILVGFFTLWNCGEYIYNSITQFMALIFTNLTLSLDAESVTHLFLETMIILGKTILPVMGAILLAGLALNYYQVGFVFSMEPLSFDLNRLNPVTGLGRIFSKRAIMELFKSIAKILVVGYFVYLYIVDQVIQMPKLIFMDLRMALVTITDIIFKLAFEICAVLLIIGLIDFMYQKWQHKQELKMSKQDIKDEFKQSEGDPQIKGKIKQKQKQISLQRMMHEVPKADVIITNPTHFAIALKYEKGMTAPVIIAKGQDLVAQRIKQIAREANVVIVENKPLARTLYLSAEIGDVVPPELYKAVAEVLAYVYRLKKKKLA
ncbi:flagellar biosynthesis protein FlhB [Pectinatus frisingensis]|uniref:flagellar biosynthesis protein FlhB n=1 Tax=Pectinatus frisingensis TaxID=865 RepID=UPI0018C74335|nr:flagellar biosynthesis protein FlhB [Pectinatus frisingensis]